MFSLRTANSTYMLAPKDNKSLETKKKVLFLKSFSYKLLLFVTLTKSFQHWTLKDSYAHDMTYDESCYIGRMLYQNPFPLNKKYKYIQLIILELQDSPLHPDLHPKQFPFRMVHVLSLQLMGHDMSQLLPYTFSFLHPISNIKST